MRRRVSLRWRSSAKLTDSTANAAERLPLVRTAVAIAESETGTEMFFGWEEIRTPVEERVDGRIESRMIGIARRLESSAIRQLKSRRLAPRIAQIQRAVYAPRISKTRGQCASERGWRARFKISKRVERVCAEDVGELTCRGIVLVD